MKRVALSGAGGNIGQVLRPALHARNIRLRTAGGRSPLTPLNPREEVMHGNWRDAAVVDRLLAGVLALFDILGAINVFIPARRTDSEINDTATHAVPRFAARA